MSVCLSNKKHSHYIFNAVYSHQDSLEMDFSSIFPSGLTSRKTAEQKHPQQQQQQQKKHPKTKKQDKNKTVVNLISCSHLSANKVQDISDSEKHSQYTTITTNRPWKHPQAP